MGKENGFLVPLYNIQELAKKICFLIEYPEKRKEMSVNAKEISKKYDISKIMNQWDRLFHDIVKTY